jgi:hypothetical protein
MKYAQEPVGWWQDHKGTMQPPGSYLDPSLRVTSASLRVTSEGVTVVAALSPSKGNHRFLDALRRSTH